MVLDHDGTRIKERQKIRLGKDEFTDMRAFFHDIGFNAQT